MSTDNKGQAPHSTGQGENGAATAESSRAVDAARFVARVLGWPVFPCHTIERGRCTCGKVDCTAQGKHPRTEHGAKDASVESIVIDTWDHRWPDSNWAVAPGASGVVIDVDLKPGGFDSIRSWDLDSAWQVNTGGGGRHYYFTTPVEVPNRNRWLPGVDVKSAGGYVLLPGSRHVSGAAYAWAVEPPEAEPPRAPRDLLDSIRSAPAGGLTSAGRFDLGDALQGLPEGQRDEGIFRAACTLRNTLAGDRGMVEIVVLEAAARCVPPFPRDEALRKVEQAFSQERFEATPEQIAWAQSAATIRPASILDAMRAALLRPGDLDNLPDPEWLIDGIVTTGSMSVLYGAPGLGKTFMALDWALRIGSGLKWFDRQVKQGSVLYVYAEGVHGLKQRQAAWVQSTGSLDSDVQFFPRAVPLLDDDWAGALAALCEELEPALVVIDTLARATAGADENSVKDMSRAVAACDAVREASGAAVMLVHHTGKDGSNYRGSSAIEGATDTMLHLTRREDGSIVLRCTKQKDAEEFEPIPVQLESIGPSAVISAAPSPQGFIDDAARSQLVAILGVHPDTWMSATTVHNEAGLTTGLRTSQRRLQELYEAGLVDRSMSGKSYVYRARGYYP